MADVEKYLRAHTLPHIWCPGCGHGTVLGAVVRAVDRAGLPHDEVVVVSGIGCAARGAGYLDFDTLHTTHGRAIPFATGIKVANPDLHLIILTGDGDAAAIGGNHLIHACRRNIDMTVVVFNNSIYGMTSGQYSPQTPKNGVATTAPYGNIERSFDLCSLTREAGATYVARGTAYGAVALSRYIEQGFKNKGFSFIEAISQCPTYYGRRNRFANPVKMLEWQRDNSVPIAKAAKLEPAELRDKIITGVMHQSQEPEYTDLYKEIIAVASKRGS